MGSRRSSTSQSTQQIDARSISTSTTSNELNLDASQGAGSYRLGDNSSLTVTDGGAVSRALQTVDGTLGEALGVVRNTTGQAFDFGEQLARVFGSQVTGSSGRALDTVDGAVAGSLAASRQANTQALDFASNVAGEALAFVRSALGTAQQSQQRATDLVATAYEDAKGRGSQTDTIIMIGLGGALLVAFFALRRR